MIVLYLTLSLNGDFDCHTSNTCFCTPHGMSKSPFKESVKYSTITFYSVNKYKLSKYPSFILCTKCRISLKIYPKYIQFNIFSFPSSDKFSKKAEMKSRSNHRRNFKFIHTLSDAFGMNNLKVYSSFIHAQSSAFVSQCPQCVSGCWSFFTPPPPCSIEHFRNVVQQQGVFRHLVTSLSLHLLV